MLLPAETCRLCDTRVDIPIRTDFVGLVHNGRKCQCGQTTSFGEIREDPRPDARAVLATCNRSYPDDQTSRCILPLEHTGRLHQTSASANTPSRVWGKLAELAPPAPATPPLRRDENGESAPEHLRNALHLIRHTGYETLAGWGYDADDLDAIRRRIASALKLLEG